MSYAKLFNLRWTGAVGNETDVLGVSAKFDVKDYTDVQNPTRKFATKCTAVFCLNKSGSTVAKGRRVLVSTDTTYHAPFAFLGLAGANTIWGAGVVSPFIGPSTVANGEGVWVITSGLTKVGYGTGTPSLTCGDKLSPAANGCVAEWDDYREIFLGIAAETKTSGSEGDLMWAHLYPHAYFC